jgi:hypothetical protein
VKTSALITNLTLATQMLPVNLRQNRYQAALVETDERNMSHRFPQRPSLDAALTGTSRTLSPLEAEIAAWQDQPPKKELRATDQLFAELRLLRRYRSLFGASEQSPKGAFEQMIEGFVSQHEFFAATGMLHGSGIDESKIETRPTAGNRLPPAQRLLPEVKRPFPRAKMPALIEAFRSTPDLPRDEQEKWAVELEEFRNLRITQTILREARRATRRIPGRRRKPQPHIG